jgi:Lon protease-like protein
MLEIPLFPLNSVIFPGTPLNLHIFEDRYKKMVAYCTSSGSPFGVVLIRSGSETSGPLAETFQIGCTADITHLQPLSLGRSNLVVMGRERFRIVSVTEDHPYLLEKIELCPINAGDRKGIIQADQRLRLWLVRYLSALHEREGKDTIEQPLPQDSITLAYVATMILQIPAIQKQILLEADSSEELFEKLHFFYRREVPLLRAILKEDRSEQGSSFSRN